MYNRLENIKNEKMFKRWDIAVGVILLISIVASFFVYFLPNGNYVEIYVNNKLHYRVPIDTDNTIIIDTDIGYNVVEISDGEVYMKVADCPDKICVHERHIKKVGEQIICLPNKVIVVIIGKKDKGEIDATT